MNQAGYVNFGERVINISEILLQTSDHWESILGGVNAQLFHERAQKKVQQENIVFRCSVLKRVVVYNQMEERQKCCLHWCRRFIAA